MAASPRIQGIDALRAVAFTTLPPGDFRDDVFAVAILDQDLETANVVGTDFTWFKAKGKYTFDRVLKSYKDRVGSDVTLKYGGYDFVGSTNVRQFNHFEDNVVVLTCHTGATASSSANSSFSSQNRTPLGPSNAQLHSAPPAVVNSALGKSPNNLMSEYKLVLSPRRSACVKREDSDIPGSEGPAVPPPVFSPKSADHSNIESGPSTARMVKNEPELEDTPMANVDPSTIESSERDRDNARLQQLIETGSPEQLEAEVKRSQTFLASLRAPLSEADEAQKDTQYYKNSIDALIKTEVNSPTIIGVVGNTGAGKSSVINALLDEERLVPTNCMRACTAVVTEMSFNNQDDENSKYRADIEFIQKADWEKNLTISLKELLDMNGNVSRDLAPDTEAGVAWAKIKSVYPNKTKEQIAHSTVQGLLNVPEVKAVLGTTTNISKRSSETFYKALQNIIDSKEKSSNDASKKKEKGEKKVYGILAAHQVIVDLPGVHDSNAARAAVAANYMKNCTGLWIVAPINRAVDDKAAKSLLGESFKRQLKFDGTYSRITFICSKTDDISLVEASESLGLQDQFAEDWEKIDPIEKEQRTSKRTLEGLKESRSVYTDILNDADDEVEVWDKLKDELEDGQQVYAPSPEGSKKRKRSAEPKKSRKKSKKSMEAISGEEDDFVVADDLDDDEEEEDVVEEEEEKSDEDGDSESSAREALTKQQIDDKLAELKDTKKAARKEKVDLDGKIKSTNQELKNLEKKKCKIEANLRAVCIKGRNTYSKTEIQRDFASGVKELDMEALQEDEDFNPDSMEDVRDYEEVAKSLPVFCVSARAAQKLSGRLVKESDVAGFETIADTELDALKAHAMRLTEAGRASNCRRFLTSFSQTLTSLTLWASQDGTGLNLTEGQAQAENRFLKHRLTTLEKSLDKAVEDCIHDMSEALAENIFENFEAVVQMAIENARPRVGHWHSPVNRVNREAGGYFWASYKAIMRRDGVFSNAQGLHDFNAQLVEPILKHLANHWERVFSQRLPRVLQAFSRVGKSLLTSFHKEVEVRTMKVGGMAGMAMLAQQLRNYEAIFLELAAQMGELISNVQREANRKFMPVIARNLGAAYEWCAAETGAGQYVRMKKFMSDHVNTKCDTMFQESCDEVKQELTQMLVTVKSTMADKTDEVFLCMSRDYVQIIAGKKQDGQTMPKWERQMRAAVREIIEDRLTSNFMLEDTDNVLATESNGKPEAENDPLKSPVAEGSKVTAEDEPVEDVRAHASRNAEGSASA